MEEIKAPKKERKFLKAMGDVAYFVNQAVKHYVETQLKNVKIINQTSFIDWELVGNYCFVSTHGKDTHNLKHGFKPKIDPNQVNKIVGYFGQSDQRS